MVHIKKKKSLKKIKILKTFIVESKRSLYVRPLYNSYQLSYMFAIFHNKLFREQGESQTYRG